MKPQSMLIVCLLSAPSLAGVNVEARLEAGRVAVPVRDLRYAGTYEEVAVGWPVLSIFGGTGQLHAEIPGWGIDGYGSLWRAGLRSTLWRSGEWSFGLGGQVQQVRAEDSILLADRPFGTSFNLMQWEIRPQITWEHQGFTVYGGPLLTWLDGSMDVGWLSHSFRVDLDRGPVGGGFVGVGVTVSNITLSVEGEFSSVSKTISVGGAIAF